MTATTQVLVGLAEAYEAAVWSDTPPVHDSELCFLTAKVMMGSGY